MHNTNTVSEVHEHNIKKKYVCESDVKFFNNYSIDFFFVENGDQNWKYFHEVFDAFIPGDENNLSYCKSIVYV